MSKVALSKITSKGQVTIPEVIRRKVPLGAGDQIEWEITDGGTIEVRRAGLSLDDLVKILPRPTKSLAVQEIDRRVRAHLVKKHRVRR